MSSGIFGKKTGMSQIFLDNGAMVPVSVIEAGPCTVTQVKTEEKDGYAALQVGFSPKRKANKPAQGHLNGKGPFHYLRELRVDSVEGAEEGQTIKVDQFAVGDKVDVIGLSKGRGFQGVVKRHGLHGGPKTHGQSDRLRGPGSIGAGTTPGRVYKGLRMAGHMGNARVTVRKLEVVRVDADRNILLIKGAVPGSPNGLLYIRKAKGTNKES